MFCWWSPSLQTQSKCVCLHGHPRFGMKMPCFHRPHLCNLSQIWRSTPRTHLTDETKPGPGNCILESKTLLMEQTTDPMRLCSGKQRLPFSPLSLSSQIGQRGSGLPLAPWALLVCWWSPELETHSKRVLLRGEAGFALMFAQASAIQT